MTNSQNNSETEAVGQFEIKIECHEIKEVKTIPRFLAQVKKILKKKKTFGNKECGRLHVETTGVFRLVLGVFLV